MGWATGLLLLALGTSFTPARAMEAGVAVLLYNQAGEKHDSLARRLEEVLRAGLQQEHRVVEVKAAHREMGAEQAAALGQALGAGAVVAGEFQVEAYRIAVRLIEAQSAQVLAEHSVSGKEGEIFSLVDALSHRMSRSLEAPGGKARTVAVAFFENGAADEYRLFVRGLSALLANDLRQMEALSLIEGKQIEKGLEHLGLAPGKALGPEEAAALGRWAGADVVVAGSFSEMHRLEVRLVEATTGRVLAALSAAGKRSEMVARAGELAEGLSRSLSAFSRSIRKVAVLGFANHGSGQHEGFVRGIADMLMTSLGQSDRLTLIERVQVDKAMENFQLELSGPIDEQTAVQVGEWLGADAVVLGSFIKFGEVYRIDARLIDARTGELLIGQDVRGAEGEVIALVDRLGAGLLESLGEKEAEVKGGTGTLQIRFGTTKAEMGERPVFYHLCKLYVDGRYLGLSPVVRKLDEEVTLFSKNIRAGKHQVQVVHGFVKDGEWDGEMPEQPKEFQVVIEPGVTTRLKYRFEVGWFSDKYLYE
jgi:TolB-like protein